MSSWEDELENIEATFLNYFIIIQNGRTKQC